ncbi:MAG: hypothetical protein QXR53_04860 [Candidatus Norongarragalinales archaeon]
MKDTRFYTPREVKALVNSNKATPSLQNFLKLIEGAKGKGLKNAA